MYVADNVIVPGCVYLESLEKVICRLSHKYLQ